ncbi:MAG: Hsp20/alpha crystallin family protein [Patescibacteria group bacterium]
MSFIKRLAGLDNKKNIDVSNNEADNEEEYYEGNEEENEPLAKQTENGEEWIDEEYEEGQLSIDVYQTAKAIIVKSTIAGVKPDEIDISINNDMLTIRGKREHQEEVNEDDYLYRECYWGSFSRSVILPVEIQADKIEAVLENGVLTITLPKAKTSKQITVKVKEK